jgi:hypothetical protein
VERNGVGERHACSKKPPRSRGGVVTRTITPEQQIAVAEAGDAPVELADPQTGTAYVLLRADVYQRMRDLLEAEEERSAWSRLARKARDQWARENAY